MFALAARIAAILNGWNIFGTEFTVRTLILVPSPTSASHPGDRHSRFVRQKRNLEP